MYQVQLGTRDREQDHSKRSRDCRNRIPNLLPDPTPLASVLQPRFSCAAAPYDRDEYPSASPLYDLVGP